MCFTSRHFRTKVCGGLFVGTTYEGGVDLLVPQWCVNFSFYTSAHIDSY
jgi:hypothetical protein